jgi:hypothetical protein
VTFRDPHRCPLHENLVAIDGSIPDDVDACPACFERIMNPYVPMDMTRAERIVGAERRSRSAIAQNALRRA